MNEIIKIIIDNYQSHEHTEIVPAPAGGLTTLVGGSDRGKTATQRATCWLLYNVPSGDDFIRVGANSAHVRIDYASGHSVIRSRSHKGFNRYEVIYPDREPEKFEGFGSSVPLEVQQITGVRPIEIGDMTLLINLADQLQGPFLGSSISALARAKVLGKLAGTEEVDYAAKSTGTDLCRRKQDVARLGVDVTRLTTAVEKYAYMEELGTKIKQAEILLASIKQNSDRLATLKKLQDQREQTREASNIVLLRLVSIEIFIEEAEPLLTRISKYIDRHAKLKTASIDLDFLRSQIAIDQKIIDRTERIGEAGALIQEIARNAVRRNNLDSCRLAKSMIDGHLLAEQDTLAITSFVNSAEILHSCAAKHEYRRSYLSGRREALNLVDYYLQNAARTLDSTQSVDQGYQGINLLQGNITKLKALRSIGDRLGQIDRQVVPLKTKLTILSGIGKADPLLNSVKNRLAYRDYLVEKRNAYRGNAGWIGIHATAIQAWSEKETAGKETYKDILLQAGVCPVCGSQIDETKLEGVI
jgi:hypothetical protein